MIQRKGAQAILEYVMLIALVGAACMAMFEYGRRAVSSNLKEIHLRAEGVEIQN